MDYASIGFRLAIISNPANKEISKLVETALTNRSESYKRFKARRKLQSGLKLDHSLFVSIVWWNSVGGIVLFPQGVKVGRV